MNVERGVRRLVIVISGFIVLVGGLAALGGDLLVIAFVVGPILAVLWAVFFAFRWVARGFQRDPEPTVRRAQINWARVQHWIVVGFIAVGAVSMAWVIGALLWQVWDQPTRSWQAVVDHRLVIWLRGTIGDQATIGIAMLLAGFIVLSAISGCWNVFAEWQQKRTHQLLMQHYNACLACQERSGRDDDDDWSQEDSPDPPEEDWAAIYCPIGQRFYGAWSRWA